MAEVREPRLTPARGDVAAAFLKGEVDAARYDAGMAYQVTASVLPLRRTPAPDGAQETQALFGETFTVYDEADGWGWGQAALDGYVGYVDMEGLSAPVLPLTHRVAALRTYRFSAPDLKSPPLGLVSMNAKIAGGATEGGYVSDQRGGYLWADHLLPLDQRAEDPVSVAERFLGAPYFWGGRESLGLDCSGLIQNAFEAIGHTPPRDADLQEQHFVQSGAVLYGDASDTADWMALPLRRGDLLFWPGHVAMMVDEARMIHANATSMAVSIDDARALSQRWSDERGLAMRTIVRP